MAQAGPAQGPLSMKPDGGVALPPSPERIQEEFDAGIWYTISVWPDLILAIQNNWGGPNGADKRDWFAGALSSLFTDDPSTDADDVEFRLLDVMNADFDVNVQDDSEVEIAAAIVKLWKQTREGDFSGVEEARANRERRSRSGRGEVRFVQQRDGENEEVEWGSEDDEEDEEDDDDVEMGDAPSLVPVREKQEPEVDEDGFTKVVGRKKR
ncbi:pre-rRNA-processing protein TSR2 [Cryomyces antarcticus]|nr:hypothetical protein LTR04_002513 [Oleoguttula sp. CCFEE 6159]